MDEILTQSSGSIFSARVRSEEAKEAFATFLEKRRLPAEAPR